MNGTSVHDARLVSEQRNGIRVILATAMGAPLRRITEASPDVIVVLPRQGIIVRHGIQVVITSAKQRRLAVALIVRRGDLLSTEECIELLYSGREDGGPEWAGGMLRRDMHALRDGLVAISLRIEGAYGRGWRAIDAKRRAAA